MTEQQKEDTLEEMWRIKREIGEEYPTWESYVAGIFAFQEEERKRGVKFVRLPPKRVPRHDDATPLFASEDGVEYDALPPATDPTP